MATSTSCSYAVISPHARQIVIVNQRKDDKYVDKLLLSLKEDSGVTVHDSDEHIIKSILFDRESVYTCYRVNFTGSVDTIRVYDRFGKLVDNEDVRRTCVEVALDIMWYETLPAIIGKKKSNGEEQDEKEEEGEVCSICCDEFQAGEIYGTLQCKHNYHKGCIKNWLWRKKLCPMCRHFAKFPKFYRICGDTGLFKKISKSSIQIRKRSRRVRRRPTKLKEYV